MEYENMRLSELKALARERRLRGCYRMRKTELFAFLQNNGRATAPRTRSPTAPPQMCVAYVTLKFDDKGNCRIHRVSKGDKEIVPNERYVVMPWKMVNVDEKRVSLKEAVDEIVSKQDELTNSTYVTLKLYEKGNCRIQSVSDTEKEIVASERFVVMPWQVANRRGKSVTFAEAVDKIVSRQESEAKERKRREREKEEIERKRAEYYEVHMKSETREALVDSRLRMLERLYRISEVNKNCGVTITNAGVINQVNYPVYPPELKILEYEDPKDFVNPFCDIPLKPPSRSKPYDQLGCFKRAVKSYQGLDEDADKYVKKVKAIIGDEGPLELKRVRQAMVEIKCPKSWTFHCFID